MVRRSLTRADFVDAALQFVDEHGAAELTARSLGEFMKVDPTALYRHFPGMAELSGAVMDRIFGDMLEAPLASGTPRERLRSFIESVHRVFYEHPTSLALLMVSRGDQPNAEAMTRRSLELLADLGLEGDDLMLCGQMLESFIVGTHMYDLGGAPDHLEVRRQRRRRLDRPDIDRSTPSPEAVDELNRRSFAAGLTALLDYCESLASTR